MSRYFIDRVSKSMVLICAAISFLVLLLIATFIAKEGMPVFGEIGLGQFLFGGEWRPGDGQFGILTMIVGSICVAIGSLLLAVPLGVACAIFLAEVAPHRIREIFRPAVELLVGIPSVVYGLVGMAALVPLVRELGGTGFSLLTAVIVLTAMVLPTIISISEDSIRSVPIQYKEAALALGANHWQTIWQVLLPAARSGIVAAAVLGMGRAVGETMAMIMVIGNSPIFPNSPLDSVRTLTGNIAVEIAYATGIHENALFATGVVLFVFIIVLNSVAFLARKKEISQ
ncbi:MAG TPA: phosphate ABC transporter permease subunit PstC [Dehalococcoidia bacterium]|nr:phosphate ABC transporter permease subunit PstC [Dehalococcoidia bacterium]